MSLFDDNMEKRLDRAIIISSGSFEDKCALIQQDLDALIADPKVHSRDSWAVSNHIREFVDQEENEFKLQVSYNIEPCKTELFMAFKINVTIIDVQTMDGKIFMRTIPV